MVLDHKKIGSCFFKGKEYNMHCGMYMDVKLLENASEMVEKVLQKGYFFKDSSYII